MSSIAHHTTALLTHGLPWPLKALATRDQNAPLDVDLSQVYSPRADPMENLALALSIALDHLQSTRPAASADLTESAHLLADDAGLLAKELHAWGSRPFADRLQELPEAYLEERDSYQDPQ